MRLTPKVRANPEKISVARLPPTTLRNVDRWFSHLGPVGDTGIEYLLVPPTLGRSPDPF